MFARSPSILEEKVPTSHGGTTPTELAAVFFRPAAPSPAGQIEKDKPASSAHPEKSLPMGLNVFNIRVGPGSYAREL
ncbi:hypothetical protein Nepgr_011741 [Nepenthes gracilis]|uniref:Uncharacterized protein n=1 Tax=Nepenthes gracilis TaxID=150966 RepID=A0AAD3XMN3_NEPGR|nr:hypothetical protein Nepgr_011741 [Nepenthes gracilis]